MFNQFHDILPGSSIPEVYVDADRAWEQAEQTSQQIVTQSLETLAAHITLSSPPQPDAKAVIVFNSLNWVRSEVVTISWHDFSNLDPSHWQICDRDGDPILHQHYSSSQSDTAHSLTFFAEGIPAIGYRTFWLCPCGVDNPHLEANQSVSDSNFTPEDSPAFGTPLQKWSKEDHAFTFASEDSLTVSTPLMKGGRGDHALIPSSQPFTLENVFLHVAIDPTTGDLSSVFDKINQREVLSGAANQLQVFQDQGQYWDAWNIDPNYAQHPLPAAELLNIQPDDQSNALQQSITVTRKIGESCFWQRYVLNHNDPILRIETEVDWQERHVLVKAAFPLTVQADRATYEIPYAAIQRPTTPQTDRDKAKWEVPALTWADLSDAELSYGVSLLSDYKHGYDAQPNQLRLTLLRSSVWPDPGADRGKRHTFTYALYPHQGNWQAAQTVRRGYEL
ncbi:MAG TPA: glycoside hydrolase family 38 C-terminal domain-containing protein, partial [Allocoleopsis sp.]